MLFHVSEDPEIREFHPRPSKHTTEPVVWAIHDCRLHNYLLPRDCPRVTYYAGAATSIGDRLRFLGNGIAIVAVSRDWWPRIREFQLFAYQLPRESFRLQDECAGYYVSPHSVKPIGLREFKEPIDEMLRRSVELRVVPDLVSLRDEVIHSSLQFSVIRLEKALGVN